MTDSVKAPSSGTKVKCRRNAVRRFTTETAAIAISPSATPCAYRSNRRTSRSGSGRLTITANPTPVRTCATSSSTRSPGTPRRRQTNETKWNAAT